MRLVSKEYTPVSFTQVIPTASLKETRPLLTASTSSTAPKVLLNYCEPKDTKKPKHKKSSVKSIKYLSGELIHTVDSANVTFN